MFQQVLAAGAFGLNKALLRVRPAHDAQPYSVELGDVSAEEECLDWFREGTHRARLGLDCRFW